MHSQDRPSHLLRQLHHGYRLLVGCPACFPSSLTDLCSYATPPLLLHLSVKAGFVYGAFSVPMCILMWLYLPETKG